MDKTRQPLAPIDVLLFRFAAFDGAAAFFGRIVVFFTVRPLAAAFGAGAFGREYAILWRCSLSRVACSAVSP